MKQIEKYKGLLDMIDGGGAGKVGDKFQGGGLLSILANALATPYGSEDRAKEELAAGLLGKTRPVMRPNRPAPSAAPVYSGRGNVGMPMRDGVYSGRGSAGMPMPESKMPLTKASDIPGGFNPANVAPVQPSFTGMTPAPSVAPDFTMPDGSPINPPAPPSQAGQYNDVPTIHQYATSVGYPDNGMSQDQLIKSYVDSLGG